MFIGLVSISSKKPSVGEAKACSAAYATGLGVDRREGGGGDATSGKTPMGADSEAKPFLGPYAGAS